MRGEKWEVEWELGSGNWGVRGERLEVGSGRLGWEFGKLEAGLEVGRIELDDDKGLLWKEWRHYRWYFLLAFGHKPESICAMVIGSTARVTVQTPGRWGSKHTGEWIPFETMSWLRRTSGCVDAGWRGGQPLLSGNSR